MKKLIFLLLIVCESILNAQGFEIIIRGAAANKIPLYSIQGERMFFVDSLTSSGKEKYSYKFDQEKNREGIYRLTLDDKRIDFIYDGNAVSLRTDLRNVQDSMRVLRPESNKIFFDFLKLNRQYKTRSELLQLMMVRYPKDDEFYNSIRSRFAGIQDEYRKKINSFINRNPGSFISKYIKGSQLPIADFNLPLEQQLRFLKSHALDNVDFKDPAMINSDLFTNKTIEYLTYFSNPQLPKELLEKEFMTAVDSILGRAKVHQLVYQHIVEYLIGGFKKFGMDQTLDYIVNNYVIKDDLCLDSGTENSIQRRIDQNKKLRLNGAAPDIRLPDMKGNEFVLAGLRNTKTVLVFYASWCPHCKTLIPELNKLYKEQAEKKFEVVAVSLDEKREEWMNFVKDNNLDWINVSELKGWSSKAASDYFIYATPTIFLIDDSLRIIGKPAGIAELSGLLKR